MCIIIDGKGSGINSPALLLPRGQELWLSLLYSHHIRVSQLSTVGILAWIILVGGCSVDHRMLSNISGLNPLDVDSTPTPRHENKKSLQTLLNVP